MSTIQDQALNHLFDAIVYDPRKYYLLGPGTQSWDLITRAVAELSGQPLEEVRANQPNEKKWQDYLAEKARDEEIAENWQNATSDFIPGDVCTLCGCEGDCGSASDLHGIHCAADADDPLRYLAQISGSLQPA